MRKTDHPAVYIPPPIIYLAFFLCSLLLQRLAPIDHEWLASVTAVVAGWVLIAVAGSVVLPALYRFAVSKNTLMTIKPSQSLQTTGIYAISRNPMYMGLLLLYCGIALLKGNWWSFILVPVLIAVITLYVIRREENYLTRAFGDEYTSYSKRVRRWL